MNDAGDQTVADIAVAHPPATKVFERYGIDFCCGGARPLREVCEEGGLDADAIFEEIRSASNGPDAAGERWDQAPLGDLVDHILDAFHGPLRHELERLDSLARKVVEVHGDKDPETLAAIQVTFLSLRAELEDHMAKEEGILFPMIRAGQGRIADSPIAVMEHEHDSAATALRRLRELTNGYEIPAEACNTWRALWQGLAAMEESLHRHIHLENNILFPRALAESAPAAGA